MPDLNKLGPIQFSIEGSFTDKPRLLMDGAEVPYDSLSVAYMPAETYEYTDMNGKEVKEELPEYISLSFTLSGKIGQLEANISYRVKANEEGKFTVEACETIVHAAKKPPFPPKKKKDEKEGDKPKDGKNKDDKGKKGAKPDFFKKKKGKSDIDASPNSITYRKNLYRDIVESIVVEDE